MLFLLGGGKMKSLSKFPWRASSVVLLGGAQILLGSAPPHGGTSNIKASSNKSSYASSQRTSSQVTSSLKEDELCDLHMDWPLRDGALKLKVTHVRYMDKVTEACRDRNKLIAAAFYQKDDGQEFEFRYVLKMRESSIEEWKDVGRGHIRGLIDLHTKRCEIKENVSDIKGITVDSSVSNVEGSRNSRPAYFYIRISCLGCKDEFRYNMN